MQKGTHKNLAQEAPAHGSLEMAAYERAAREAAASLQEAKARLRSKVLAERNKMSQAERVACDARIFEQVTKLSAYQAANLLLAYMPTGSEVDVRPIIEDAWKQKHIVALPRCVAKGQLAWHKVESFDELEEGAYHILEPLPESPTIDPHAYTALCLVPGAAFDIAGFRIGYGGGYYDRFLYDFSGTSVGVVREAQLVDSIDCVEAHDRAVDFVCCESRTI